MQQGRGLQGLAGCLPGHLHRGVAPQVIVDERQQILGRAGLAPADSMQDLRDLTHGRERARARVASSTAWSGGGLAVGVADLADSYGCAGLGRGGRCVCQKTHVTVIPGGRGHRRIARTGSRK